MFIKEIEHLPESPYSILVPKFPLHLITVTNKMVAKQKKYLTVQSFSIYLRAKYKILKKA